MKVAAIVHVFYPEIWPEVAVCVRNIGECDLVVTYVDEAAIEGAKKDFPNAKYVKCENRGYDIWPFLKALQGIDLSRYELVVKLHTKRDVITSYKTVIAHTLLNDSCWREHLLAFVRTPEAWQRTVRRFESGKVGMVADRHIIFDWHDAKTDAHRDSFDRALTELKKWGIATDRRARFVGGTMFAARSGVLKAFVEHGFSPEMFGESQGHDTETYAHVVERMLGLAVCGQGYRVVAFNGSITWRRMRYALKKFLFDSRRSERRRSIRIFGITVYMKRLVKEADNDN